MTSTKQQAQGGFALIEALVSIAIFSFALVGLVSLQSVAVASSIDAKNRSDASYLASQIIGRVWSDRGAITTYNHLGTGAPCTASGAASTNPAVLGWLSDVAAALPGASSSVQSLAVGAGNTLTVTICWKRVQETSYHRHVTVAQIN
jgi:type IV pilus assembly protein PilV